MLGLTQYHGRGALDVVFKSRKLGGLIDGYLGKTFYVMQGRLKPKLDSTRCIVFNQDTAKPTGRVLNYTSCHLARIRLYDWGWNYRTYERHPHGR